MTMVPGSMVSVSMPIPFWGTLLAYQWSLSGTIVVGYRCPIFFWMCATSGNILLIMCEIMRRVDIIAKDWTKRVHIYIHT